MGVMLALLEVLVMGQLRQTVQQGPTASVEHQVVFPVPMVILSPRRKYMDARGLTLWNSRNQYTTWNIIMKLNTCIDVGSHVCCVRGIQLSHMYIFWLTLFVFFFQHGSSRGILNVYVNILVISVLLYKLSS